MKIVSTLTGAIVLAGVLVTPAAAQIPDFVPPPAPATPARNLQLAFHSDGTVSLAAGNVTTREILAEWARQCGCYIVNWDKLSGGPLGVPVQYERQSQKKVLESLLRQAAGYVLTPKRAGSTMASNYETIYILATSSPVGGAYVPPPVSTPAAMTMPTPGSPEDEIPAVGGQPGQPGGAPAGPPRPGMPTAAPNTPGVPANQGPRAGGMPSVFVPIVPITSTPATQTPSSSPGMPTSPGMPSGTPVPIVPAPQNR